MKTPFFICCITPCLYSSDYYALVNKISKWIFKPQKILGPCSWIPPEQYKDEMGNNLQTVIWVFETKLSIAELVEVKKQCMFFEKGYSKNGQRQFNLNPGFVSSEGMFLLTHKDNVKRGRVPIGHSTWIEKQYDVTENGLVFNQNTFSEYVSRNRLCELNNLYSKCLRTEESFAKPDRKYSRRA